LTDKECEYQDCENPKYNEKYCTIHYKKSGIPKGQKKSGKKRKKMSWVTIVLLIPVAIILVAIIGKLVMIQ